MGIVRGEYNPFQETEKDIATARMRREQEKVASAAMQGLIASVAMKNCTTEEGKLFETRVPAVLSDLDIIDFRTTFAMIDSSSRALPASLENNTLFSQASSTSAIAELAVTASEIEIYGIRPKNIQEYFKTEGIAAD